MKTIRIENILAQQAKKVGKVFSQENMDILTIQLRAGEKIPAHNAKETVVVIVRSGEVRFEVQEKQQILTAEDVLIIEPLDMHSLEAITDVDIVVLKLKIS